MSDLERIVVEDLADLNRQIDEQQGIFCDLARVFERAIYISSIEGKFLYANKKLGELLGYTAEELTELDIVNDLYVNPDDRAKFMSQIEEDGSVHKYMEKLKKNDGTRFPASLTVHPIFDKTGKIIAYYGEIENITDYLTDSTTGLIRDRKYFFTELTREIETARKYSTPLSLLFFDMDNFKEYNDDKGHPAGDEALRNVGALILENIRKADLGVRLGGDEFGIILHGSTAEESKQIAERILKSYKELKLGITELSVGITELKPDDDIDAFFSRADTLMYKAKRNGNKIEIG